VQALAEGFEEARDGEGVDSGAEGPDPGQDGLSTALSISAGFIAQRRSGADARQRGQNRRGVGDAGPDDDDVLSLGHVDFLEGAFGAGDPVRAFDADRLAQGQGQCLEGGLGL